MQEGFAEVKLHVTEPVPVHEDTLMTQLRNNVQDVLSSADMDLAEQEHKSSVNDRPMIR